MVKEFITDTAKCDREIICEGSWEYVMKLDATELLAKFGLPGCNDLFQEFETSYDDQYRRFYEIETIEILV